MIKQKLFVGFLSTIIVLNIRVVFSAQIPKSESGIPIFTGASRDMETEKERKEQMSWENDPNLRSAILKLYITAASAEEVFGFYLQAIGGKEGDYYEDPVNLSPGSTTPVSYEIETYNEQDFDDAMYDSDFGESKHLGKWRKDTLIKNRKPYKAGQWIKHVCFEWGKKEANSDLTTFYLNIFDNSFDVVPNEYKPTTEIEIQVTTSKSEEAMMDEIDEDMDRDTESLSRSLASHPPTEKVLGVPLYPGAKFDAANSAGMSTGNDYAMYLYLINDPPAKVVSFYEQKLKIKAESMGNDQYMIPLKGKMPVPDEGLSIQPNTMFGGNAKTVMTVQKMAGGNE